MKDLSLTRYTVKGVTLLGNGSCPSGVTLAFSERTGGMSEGAFTSLNLDMLTGDEPAHVSKNIRRLCDAAGCADIAEQLVHPKQIHSSELVRVTSVDAKSLADVRAACEAGADGVVCTVPGVPALVLAADCALVALVAKRGFAVLHSGRPGTYQRISAKAVEALAEETGEDPSTFAAAIGPHISGQDYEVGEELVKEFVEAFGEVVRVPEKPLNLDFGAAIEATLREAGVPQTQIYHAQDSTYSNTGRYFGYRHDKLTGRHGLIAYMR